MSVVVVHVTLSPKSYHVAIYTVPFVRQTENRKLKQATGFPPREGIRRKDFACQDISLSQTFNLIVSLVNGEPIGSDRVNSRFKKRTRRYSLMALNRANDVSS